MSEYSNEATASQGDNCRWSELSGLKDNEQEEGHYGVVHEADMYRAST